MGEYEAAQVVKTLIGKNININGAEVLLIGITFKENCPVVRNIKIVDIERALKAYYIKVTIYDPWANPAEVMHEYWLKCHNETLRESTYDAIVLGVANHEFLELDLSSFKFENAIVYDVKGILKNDVDGRL